LQQPIRGGQHQQQDIGCAVERAHGELFYSAFATLADERVVIR
jgi:hypothetical protein